MRYKVKRTEMRHQFILLRIS